MTLRPFLVVGLLLVLSACASERQFARDTWPFGNPNAPAADTENGLRAIGQVAVVAPIPPQAGDVWPGPVAPVPTISQMEQNMSTPLGEKFTPSLPSPYPPGQGPADDDGATSSVPPLPSATPPIVPTPLPSVTPQSVTTPGITPPASTVAPLPQLTPGGPAPSSSHLP